MNVFNVSDMHHCIVELSASLRGPRFSYGTILHRGGEGYVALPRAVMDSLRGGFYLRGFTAKGRWRTVKIVPATSDVIEVPEHVSSTCLVRPPERRAAKTTGLPVIDARNFGGDVNDLVVVPSRKGRDRLLAHAWRFATA